MIPFDAATFMKMHRVIAGFYRDFIALPEPKGVQWPLDSKIQDADRGEFRRLYEYHKLVCDELGFTASTVTLNKIFECLDNASSTYKQYFALGPELGDRLVDEVSCRQFIALSPKEAEHYAAPQAGWGEVLKIFPTLATDVSEASRCFALGRYTATVFHLMRVMELTVRALSKKLQIKNVERSWGNLLSDVARAVEAMPKGEARDEWSEALSLLYHVKQAWRNDVMHPKQTYTEEEAIEVLDATKSFVRYLMRLDRFAQ